MASVDTMRMPRLAGGLLLAVGLAFMLQIGVLISQVLADSGGGTGSTAVTADVVSDQVAATAAEFRVDESGAAIYSIPIYGVPGTAGVAPSLALSYSSQGSYGPLGKGWAISGLSSVTRCRATREAGDFITSGQPTDGSPVPVNFTSTDRYCLDGQRLLPAQSGNAACLAVSGMTATNLRTEIDSFQRVCAYTPSSGTAGVAFFKVERKDGSTSWYGDRDNDLSANRTDGYVNSTAPGKTAFALAWAQTRFQDSTGNYIDYLYYNIQPNTDTREHLIKEVKYTGKTVLSGQTGSALAPYASIVFTYATRPTTLWSYGYQSGGRVAQSRELASITAKDGTQSARFYQLNYTTSVSGSGFKTLTSVQECRDSTKAMCLPATAFNWSGAKYELATATAWNVGIFGSTSKFEGYKLGDVDGDGRPDMVWLKDGSSGSTCPTEHIEVSFGELDSSGRQSFAPPAFGGCTPTELMSALGNASWQLFDYNGDGKDDLFVAGDSKWGVFASVGRTSGQVFGPSDLIASLSPAIPMSYTSADGSHPQLTDLNGDGLIDVVYPRSGMVYARVMKRIGATWGWGAELAVTSSSLPATVPCGNNNTVTCSLSSVVLMNPSGNYQIYDYNGDAASDLLITAVYYGVNPYCDNNLIQGQSTPPAFGANNGHPDKEGKDEFQLPAAGGDDGVANALPPGEVSCPPIRVAVRAGFNTKTVGSTTVSIGKYFDLTMPFGTNTKLADFNGDGLTDIVSASGVDKVWSLYLNTGIGFTSAITIGTIPNDDLIQAVDLNGDGRTDLTFIVDLGNGSFRFFARYALSTGGFSGQQEIPGSNAYACQGNGCDPRAKAHVFADLDGDGVVDFLALKLDDNPDFFLSQTTSRGVPRDVITTVTNGLGAVTQISYAALDNAAIHLRDAGSRNGTNWGRGAPVFDVIAPSYVVSKAASSSPQAGNPTAMATLYYRYAGAKMQAGGRGFLGFREIATIDPNQTGGYVVTTTSYAQNFPFVGMPLHTVKAAVLNQTYVPSLCLTTPRSNICFASPGQNFPSLGGSWFSDSTQVWEGDTEIASTAVTAFAPGVQAPVHVRTAGTTEMLRDPFTGAQTSRVDTAFDYGAYGNATTTIADTYTGTSATPTATIVTNNVYGSDSPTYWRLGRLTSSTVTHQRPSRSNVVRSTGFAYDMAGARTGLLTAERLQAGAGVEQDLRKEYTYDAFGNRTLVATCADPATTCSTAIAFHPATPTSIQRYSRAGYDSKGRYPVLTYEPFWNGSTGVERITQTVVKRDIFGNVTQAYDLNGVDTLAVAGTFGRAYYAWVETVAGSVPGTPTGGIDSVTTYRWCGGTTGQVSCPTGATFRQKVVTDGAPTQWSYFDVLGRPIMQAASTFNVGVSGKDVSAVCTGYDATGKPIKTSNPFFLAGTEGSDGPTGLTSVCSSASRLWTTTSYDILGRPMDMQAPDASVVSTDYVGNQTLVTDARGNVTTQTRNGLGEVTSVVDANGLTMTYSYQADGSNYMVSRDAGRGAVQNLFWFDALGRKTKQTDPDSGTTNFAYNALGELTAQVDASGNRIENEIDARGRIWRKTVKQSSGIIESQTVNLYDTAAYGAGQLASEAITGTYAGWSGQTTLALGFSRGYAYDTLGRPSGSTTIIDGVSYNAAVKYDSLGRPWKAQDASGRWAKTTFNARGQAAAVCNSSSTDAVTSCPNDVNTYLRTLETDHWGHVTKERRGNSAAMDVTRDYVATSGRIFSICAGNSTSCNLMSEGYAWDNAGNLAAQQKENRYLETFTYDSLNRLTDAKLTMQDGVTVNIATLTLRYDMLGNLCRKGEKGRPTYDYTYTGRAGCGLGGTNSSYGGGGSGTVGPHQLFQLGTDNFYYDGRGNQTVKDAASSTYDRTIKYSIDDQAYEAVSGTGVRTRFWYGSDGARYKRDDDGKKTLYLGNVEIVTQGAVTTTKRTIAGVMLQTVIGATATNYYLFHDQLGSLVKITNATGGVVSSQDYAALGYRRDVDTQYSNGGTVPALTTRGFTGHEMVDGALNLIHMNGRIFDPGIGRFLQADPVIQDPGNTQSWNAYTYVLNNPLTYTDPTGMLGQKERQWLAVAIGIVAAVFGQWYASYELWGAAFAIGVTGAFVAGAIATQSLSGGLRAAFGAAITLGIGMGDWGYWQTIGAQAVSGGVMESISGGNFGNGFFAAGLTAAFMPQVGKISNDVGRTITGALVGGTISEATGGKFANGAVSGAIQAAMAGSSAGDGAADTESGYVERSDAEAAKIGPLATDAANEALGDSIGEAYSTLDSAARAWGKAVRPVASKYNTEIASQFFKVKGGYAFGSATSDGYINSVDPSFGGNVSGAFYTRGYIHTHPSNNLFSKNDLNWAHQMRQEAWGIHQRAYVVLKNGSIYSWSTLSWASRPQMNSWNGYMQDARKVRP